MRPRTDALTRHVTARARGTRTVNASTRHFDGGSTSERQMQWMRRVVFACLELPRPRAMALTALSWRWRRRR
eukprot:3839282-Pleurochrysis_carterae.AAC.1